MKKIILIGLAFFAAFTYTRAQCWDQQVPQF
jgi:hypothetical protein